MKANDNTLVIIVENGEFEYLDRILAGDYTLCGYSDEGSTNGDIMRSLLVNDKNAKVLKVTEANDMLKENLEYLKAMKLEFAYMLEKLKFLDSEKNAHRINILNEKIMQSDIEIKKFETAISCLKLRAKGFAKYAPEYAKDADML